MQLNIKRENYLRSQTVPYLSQGANVMYLCVI